MDAGYINYIKTSNGKEHPIDASKLDGKELADYQLIDNLVTSIDSNSKSYEYPSAKCIWTIVGDLDSIK